MEHFSAQPPGAAPASLRLQGRALLAAVATDLAAVPGVTAEIALNCGGGASGFDAVLARCDAALVVAPEHGGVLERLVRRAGRGGRLLLGPGPRAVRLASDKWATARRLEALGIPVPWSRVVPRRGAVRHLSQLEPPFVVKPRDGCGSLGVSVVRAPSEVSRAASRVDEVAGRPDLLVEEHVEGEPASVSVLVAGSQARARGARALCLALNRQLLRGRRCLRYEGGETPWRHPQAGEAMRLAALAVEAVAGNAPDLSGYVGIDLVLAPDGPRVIEINPRLTTSYLGLRRVARASIAGLMLDAALGRSLPRRLELRGRCTFRPDGRVRVTGGRGALARPWPSIAAGTSAAST